ncbi:MAG: helix-turn-helix domain-containing protein, partial [Lachnospiraceae bacterium]|nr:helix-turn-helix domain-containing protein [Lachnospiraceae bacterium]
TQEGLSKLSAWARDGLTDEKIAGKVGISRSTLNEWKKNFPDISDTLKKGKEIVDIQVENALLKRALGYEYEEVSEKYQGGSLMERKVTTKQVVPDTTAQIFWLKNRKPEQWKDRQEMRLEGELETEKSKLDDLIRQMGM